MEKIEFTASFKAGGKDVTAINVKPITFVELGKLWAKVPEGPRAQIMLNRMRISHQTHFMNNLDRVYLNEGEFQTLPAIVAKPIMAQLDANNGVMGKVVGEGDGATSPVLYKLGTPIEMKQGEAVLAITELEFMANTYGELEDVLAADQDIEKATLLIQNVAVPIGVDSLQRLPGWALDRLTVADGVGIMQKVLPNF